MKKEKITLALPSLIHRVGSDVVKQAKEIALRYDCELKRVRRSRNWQLSGEAINIQSYAEFLVSQLKQNALEVQFSYLIQKIKAALLTHADKLEPLSAKLERLVNNNPNITLAELMQISDCTLVEARTARFKAQSW